MGLQGVMLGLQGMNMLNQRANMQPISIGGGIQSYGQNDNGLGTLLGLGQLGLAASGLFDGGESPLPATQESSGLGLPSTGGSGFTSGTGQEYAPTSTYGNGLSYAPSGLSSMNGAYGNMGGNRSLLTYFGYDPVG